MCDFTHLSVGEKCTLYTDQMQCVDCGHVSGGVIADAVYLGHSENTDAVYDRFQLTSLHTCPGCKERFKMYQSFCTSWTFTTKSSVTQQIKL